MKGRGSKKGTLFEKGGGINTLCELNFFDFSKQVINVPLKKEKKQTNKNNLRKLQATVKTTTKRLVKKLQKKQSPLGTLISSFKLSPLDILKNIAT